MHMLGSNFRSSDYHPDTLPMLHYYFIHMFNFRSCYPVVSSVGPPVSGVHALALVQEVAGIHACYSIASVSSVVIPTVTSVHALVFTHALAGTHALASVSECMQRPCIFSWPMVISNSVNEFFVAV